jgi:CRP/FNR family cyclic AMP-dependent transcriptional regulator
MKKTNQKTAKKINHPFLKGLSAKYQKILLQGSEVLEMPKAEFIFRDGGKADQFFLILKGKVDILTVEQDVRFDVETRLGILQTLNKGDIVGWSWVIPHYRWKFNARVHEDAELLVMDGRMIREKMAKNPKLAVEIYCRLVPVMNDRLLATRMKFALYGGKPFPTEEGG